MKMTVLLLGRVCTPARFSNHFTKQRALITNDSADAFSIWLDRCTLLDHAKNVRGNGRFVNCSVNNEPMSQFTVQNLTGMCW